MGELEGLICARNAWLRSPTILLLLQMGHTFMWSLLAELDHSYQARQGAKSEHAGTWSPER